MGNSLNMDLHGKTVVLKEKALKPQYRGLPDRLFKVDGGFGASAGTMGTALIGEFLIDKERARMEGYMVERLATEDDLEALLVASPGVNGEGI
jgi:hypothetical protein